MQDPFGDTKKGRNVGPCWNILEHFGPVSAILYDLETFGPLGSFFGPLWPVLKPFGKIWDPLGPFGAIWDPFELFGTIMDHFGPFWTIFDHLAYFEP